MRVLPMKAAALAKADLVSGMVGEFPELQGIMGRYYARHEKLPDAVADAIADHYKPLGPNDTCPSAPVSVAVALADKIDTLTGFFAIDEKPTGSEGSVRFAPRGTRHHPAHPREQAAPAFARCPGVRL